MTKPLVVILLLALFCLVNAVPKPFSTNINTNYNNCNNTNTNTLVLTLLNYIINLLQVIQNNNGLAKIPALERTHIPSFPLHEIQRMLHVPAVNQQNQALQPVSSRQKESSADDFRGDFDALQDYVDHNIIKRKHSGSTKKKSNPSNGKDSTEDLQLVSYDLKQAVEDAIKAFKGPVVPPPITRWQKEF